MTPISVLEVRWTVEVIRLIEKGVSALMRK
jgi:hypothetical protein